MRITLKQLMIFEAVARQGQVAKAAARVNLSAPATSMALSELERQLDARLFERIGNKLQLNSQGAMLLPLATTVLQQVEAIEQAFAPSATVLAGTLNVCASNTIGNFLLAKAAVAFCQLHPETHVELNIDNSLHVVRDVAEFRAELGFIEGYCLDNRIDVTTWHHDQLKIFCHPAHPLAGKTVQPQEVSDALWVLREEGSGTREYFVNAANKLNLRPEVRFTFPTPDAIKQAVKQGAGLGVLSALTIDKELTRKEVNTVEVAGMTLERPFYLLRHKHHSTSPLAQAFIEFCANFLRLQPTP
ncbi:LysR substrate-binding domain-containing protein [Shewanella sp. C32]|uniref:LysR substrate-binding domain-containing protein n=1 Tax=Shewanella electrica TaxID=515560 RepID=A0ABT2FS01_9GAMM|nr:LysR substrate-binding domain-containing protein [Shewanella electrica]MCH1926844.1 LysR substrate-binding domain-containing protein [Shewanella electrica]MCS4558405.1 LysR substrate-binding domain-containing protein [Shewanella electrica]